MKKNNLAKQNLLIEILLDPCAEDGEKDDAAMDLAEFNNEDVLNALTQAAINAKKNDFFLNSCGESIAEIWIKNNKFDSNIFVYFPCK